MRILLVNSERGYRGGEFQTAALAEGLSERGIEVHVAAAERSRLAQEIEGRVTVHRFTFETIPLWTPIGLGRLIRRVGVDLVHAQTSRAHTHAWMAVRSVRDAPPLVVSRRVAFATSGGFLSRMKYLSGVAHYLPISEAAAGSLRSIGVPDERMTIIPSGVRVSAFGDTKGDVSLLERWGIAGRTAIVGTVAALEREKGLDVLLGAADIVLRSRHDCAFVIMGEGRERRRLEALIERSGLEGRVVLADPVKRLESVLPLFTVYVLPSLEEGMSTSLVAALAAGRAVVATRTGGVPEVVGEAAAVLVPPGDAGALAVAVTGLLEDPGRRERLAAQGRSRAASFDIERTIDATLTLYRSILPEGQAR
jgi:glycosyltransferase involved in cell wall biosynthesis